MSIPEWSILVRNYDKDSNDSAITSDGVSIHPLLPRSSLVNNATKINSSSSTTTIVSIDPLSDPLSSMTASMTIDDPLSTNSRSSNIIQTNEITRKVQKDINDQNLNTPWQIRKQQIIQEYVVTGSITLSTTAFNEFAGSGVEDGSATRHLDKYTDRLAGLERKAAMEKRKVNDDKIQMSQKEYSDHIQRLSKDLSTAWSNDERVSTLKIAIQLSKLLADTNMPQFYPSMFVMVTNELDKFSDMVYNRLIAKAEEALNEGSTTNKKKRLPFDFMAADIPTVAKDTCRNWFYKTACIRELLPRLYVEMTLLKCYRFLTDSDYPQILSRLGSIIRGLGDPLVSLYARTYLAVLGNEVCPQNTKHTWSILQDTIQSFKMLQRPFHQSELKNRWKISHKEYMRVMSPGFEWLFKCVGRNASKETFQNVLQQFRDICNDTTVLKHIIDSFEGSHYSYGALGMCTLIKSAEISWISQVELFASLGKQLSIYPPPEEQRLPLLNEVWKIVTKSDDIKAYVQCSAAWLDAVHKHYSEREMLILLADLNSKLSSHNGELSDSIQRQLESIITSLISQTSAYGSTILTSDYLLKILDMFNTSRRVSVSKDIFEAFKSHGQTNDAVLINTLFDIGKNLHDSVDCLSADGDTKYVAMLLNSFIEKINFGKDLEQQLNVYVECRAIFSNLDLVKDKLILCVGSLAVKAYKFMKCKHTKKTAAFVKACLAFCHITIPSISDVQRKLQLLLYCAQVALLNQCLPQTDTFLKAAISLIPDVPTHEELEGKRVHTEEKLASYLKYLLSTLVVTPGHPEHGPFYIVQGLLNAMPKFQWQPNTGVQTKVYIDMLALLCTYAQRRFPYHILHIESNDDLYGGSPDYMSELRENIDACVQEILKQLTALGERTEPAAKLNQARLLLDFINQIIARMQISIELGDFILKLLDLASKFKNTFTRGDQRYLSNTIEQLKIKANQQKISSSFINSLKNYQ